MLHLGVKESSSKHIGIITETLVFIMHFLDMSLLLLVKLSVVQGLFLEVINFSLQVLNLSVLFKFKFLCVNALFKVAKLTHDHVHVATIGI